MIEHATSIEIRRSTSYELRSLDREPGFDKLSLLERASRIIFLNKTCFNGLFRVNSHGQFNVPFFKYSNPRIVDDVAIKAVSRYFNEGTIEMSSDDFEEALSGAGPGDFVYLDPPYDPLSDTSSFTGHNLPSFDRKEQRDLREFAMTSPAAAVRFYSAILQLPSSGIFILTSVDTPSWK